MIPEPASTETGVMKNTSEFSGTLSQRVYKSLREAILALKLAPGSILRKGVICDELGVSRSPVSEAMAKLSAEGLVDIIPQSATRVSLFSMSEIREGAFIREALELAAVGRVSLYRTDEQMTALSRNLRLQTLLLEDNDFEGFFHADEEFHRLLLSFTGFLRLVAMAEVASLQITRARVLLLPTPGRAGETISEHAEIVEAIRAQDANRATAATKTHLSQLITRLEPLERDRPELFRAIGRK